MGERNVLSYVKPAQTGAELAAAAARALSRLSVTGAKVAVSTVAARNTLKPAGFVHSRDDAGHLRPTSATSQTTG